MKIAFPYNTFPGGFIYSIERGFYVLGHDTFIVNKYKPSLPNKLLRRIKLDPIKEYGTKMKEELFNKDFFEQIMLYKPDIFMNVSGSGLFPTTIKKIKENTKCLMACYVADNPCDPDPRRDKYFPMSLQYYDIFLNPEPVWDKIIYNLSAKAKVIRFYGGYDHKKYFPINLNSISSGEKKELECDISFTGGGYYTSPEGAYRAGILGQLEGYNVKIWGDKGWDYRFKYYPLIRDFYMGERLPYDKLIKLYALSKINLNLPSPQIFTSFQPRVFEIAAAKGFQIIDHSNELYNIFENNEVVTFRGISDLREKIKQYIKHEDLRTEIAEKMYLKIKDEYTWENQVKKLLQMM